MDTSSQTRSGMTRASLLPPMAAHVLQHGMAGASLRPLAKAAGTSDRMLIYHFGNKQELVSELLAHIAATYAEALDSGFRSKAPRSRRALLEKLIEDTRAPAMAPFLALWWEIVAGSARNAPGYREAAQAVMERLLHWLESRMPAGDPDPAGGARFLLTLIEGSQMLSAVGQEAIARAGLEAAVL